MAMFVYQRVTILFHGDQQIDLLQVRSAGSSELKIFSLASGRLYVSFLLRFSMGSGVGVGGEDFEDFEGFLLVMALVMVGGTYLVDFLSIFEAVELEIAREGTQGDCHQTHHASQLSTFTLKSS